MLSIMDIVLALFLVLSIDLTLSAPSEGVNTFAALIEAEALKLSEDSLQEDQILTQEIVQGSTIYRHVKSEKHGAPVFIRKSSEEGKAVVILAEGEDYLPKCKGPKRTFVVLKQSPTDKNTYRAFYAYVRDTMPLKVEWDAWFPRGNPRNKALSFGFVRCTKSSMIPCKKEVQVISDDSPDYEDFSAPSGKDLMPLLPYSHPTVRVNSEGGSDYFCDLHEGSSAVESRFTGSVIGALAQSMVVLSGAEVVYKDDQEMVKDIQKDIKAVSPEPKMKGRGMANSNNVSAAAAQKLVDLGRQTVAGGTLLFYAAVVKIGALALHQLPPNEEPGAGSGGQAEDEKIKKYKTVGLNILRGFFQGVNAEDPEQPLTNPNPELLLKEQVVADLMAGRGVGQSSQSGRSILSWITGKADIGTSSSNGEQVIRQYKGIQRDGSVSGSKGVDNLNYAIDNAFGGTRKSAGQIFSENIVAGVYMPYGLIEDAADGLGGAILGIGRVSTDRSYIDDILDKAMNVVAGAGGQVVDVVGDILGPIGLGGLWNGVSGFAAGTLGAIGGGIASPVLGIYQLVKMGAKAIGIGGVIGMYGDESRQANIGGNQNVDRYSPPQMMPQTVMIGRKKRDTTIQTQEQIPVSITDVDLFSHMGWRTVDILQNALPNASFAQDEPFIGFANCIYKKPSQKDFETATTAKDLVTLYARSLRVQCLQDQVEALNELFTTGYLTLGADKTFTINPALPVLSKAKLSLTEINRLSKAFEISIYTKVHAQAAKTAVLAAGSSPSASFLKLMTLTFLDDAEKIAPLHYIKLTRNVAKIVKTGFTKSLEDFFRYKHCRKCNEEQMKETLNDSILLLALTDFILVEQEQKEFNSGEKVTAFGKWFTANRESVAKKISPYFL